MSDKAWDDGERRDATGERDHGWTRQNGDAPGWALALRESGSWSFNLSDGRCRVDYRAESQRVDDGAWHHLAVRVDAAREVAHLHFDGARVATLCLESLGGWCRGQPASIGKHLPPGTELHDVSTASRAIEESAIRAAWEGRRGRLTQRAADKPPSDLRVMTWNLWHGGREDGVDVGLRRTIDVIREADPDLLAMQETYGSAPAIADALGYVVYSRSPSLSILSRFPIVETHALSDPDRCGGVTVRLPGGHQVTLMNIWLHYLPDIHDAVHDSGATPEALVRGERRRMRELEDVLAEVRQRSWPGTLLIAGDFNTPSHLDFVESTRQRNHGLVVEWPVSLTMTRAGFVDALRTVHPDPRTTPGNTWSPRFTGAFPHRIDYVYVRDGDATPIACRTWSDHPVQWPSDHAAVMATFELLESHGGDGMRFAAASGLGWRMASAGR